MSSFGPSPPPPPKKRALLIGINYLSDAQNRLRGCINDVLALRDLLTSQFGYDRPDLTILSDDGQNDGVPTRAEILRQIDRLVELTRAGDLLYVAYSGHGTYVVDDSGDESGNEELPGCDSCLCPCDFQTAGLISDDDLRERLVDRLPAGAKLRATFDACHSGTMLDLRYLWRAGSGGPATAAGCRRVEEKPERPTDDVVAVSGCRDDQTSADAYNAALGRPQGELTMALVRALQTSRKVRTTWVELVLVARHSIAAQGYDQIPQLQASRPDLVEAVVDL